LTTELQNLPSIWTDRRNHDTARSWVMADAVVRDFQTAEATIRAVFRMEQMDAPARAYDQQNEARTACYVLYRVWRRWLQHKGRKRSLLQNQR